MLFLSREYVDNSSGSDSAAEESPPLSTAPPPRARDEGEFEYQRPPPRIQPRSNPQVRESMPIVRSNPWMDDQPDRDQSPRRAGFITDFAAPAHLQEVKKPAKDEKVGIYIPEPPKERPALQRPGTGSARPGTGGVRPGTGNAAMRARMLEQQKNHLMGRKESMQVTANIVDPRARLRSDQPLEMLEKLLEKPSGKTFQGYASHIGAYEPVVARREEKLPAPVTSGKTVFKEEIEEVRLDESTAVRNTASKALQHLRRKSQDDTPLAPSQPAYKPAVAQPPQHMIPAPHVVKRPAPGVAIAEKEDSDEEMYRADAASRFSLEEVQPTLPQARVLGQGREPPKRDPPVQAKNPPTAAATDDRINRRPMTAQHTRAGSMPPALQEPERPVEPVRPKMNLRVLLASEMQDMKRFLTTPVHQDVVIQCSIRREKGGLKNRFYPKYFMHLSDGYTFLLAGKKRANNKTSNYLMSMNQKEMTTKSPAYLGKVRSNFLGTEFIIFDTGLNPSKKSATRDNSREELGVVLYQSNILGTKGPRKMRVLIPVVNSTGEQLQWKPMIVTPTQKQEGMLERYKAGDTSGMLSYFNKPPKWNDRKDYSRRASLRTQFQRAGGPCVSQELPVDRRPR